jgi:hypothetical protein
VGRSPSNHADAAALQWQSQSHVTRHTLRCSDVHVEQGRRNAGLRSLDVAVMSGKHASRFAVRAACLLHEFDFELQVSITMLKTAAVGREVGGESHIVGVSSGVLHRPAVWVALFRICWHR